MTKTEDVKYVVAVGFNAAGTNKRFEPGDEIKDPDQVTDLDALLGNRTVVAVIEPTTSKTTSKKD